MVGGRFGHRFTGTYKRSYSRPVVEHGRDLAWPAERGVAKSSESGRRIGALVYE